MSSKKSALTFPLRIAFELLFFINVFELAFINGTPSLVIVIIGIPILFSFKLVDSSKFSSTFSEELQAKIKIDNIDSKGILSKVFEADNRVSIALARKKAMN